MKGGRTAPRDLSENAEYDISAVASMKGGRTAPRDPDLETRLEWLIPASMKGGRTAPRDRLIAINYEAISALQ